MDQLWNLINSTSKIKGVHKFVRVGGLGCEREAQEKYRGRSKCIIFMIKNYVTVKRIRTHATCHCCVG